MPIEISFNQQNGREDHSQIGQGNGTNRHENPRAKYSISSKTGWSARSIPCIWRTEIVAHSEEDDTGRRCTSRIRFRWFQHQIGCKGLYESSGHWRQCFHWHEFAFQKAFEALCHSTHLYGRRLVLEWAAADEGVEELRKRTAEHFQVSQSAAKRNKKGVFDASNVKTFKNSDDEGDDEWFVFRKNYYSCENK